MSKGKGIYARGDLRGRVDSWCEAHGFDFAALTPSLIRSDASLMTRPFYVYSTPSDGWFPHDFERTILEFERLALASGARGYYADTEWGRSVPWNDADVARLARALTESQRRSGLDIIVTDFYADGLWRKLGRACGHAIGLSMQLYQKRSMAQNSAIMDEMRAAGWDDIEEPSLATYKHVVIPGPTPNEVHWLTPQEQRDYLDSFPPLRGGIFWYPEKTDVAGIPNALANVIAQWHPGVDIPFVGPIARRTLLIIAGVVTLLLLVLAVIARFTVR